MDLLIDSEHDGCIRQSCKDANLQAFANNTNINYMPVNDFANIGIIPKIANLPVELMHSIDQTNDRKVESDVDGRCSSLMHDNEIKRNVDKSGDNITMNSTEGCEKFGNSFEWPILKNQKPSSFKDDADPLKISTGSNSHDQEHSEIQETIQKFFDSIAHESLASRNEKEIHDIHDLSNKGSPMESMRSARLPAHRNARSFRGNYQKLINVVKAERDQRNSSTSSTGLNGYIAASIKNLTSARKRRQEKDEGQSYATTSKQLRIMSSKIVKCSICKAEFKNKNKLQKHKKSQHPPEDNCKSTDYGKAFKCLAHAENYKLLEQPELKVNRCNYCDGSFALLRDLITSKLRAQSIKKKLRCDKCGSYFLNLDFFLAHLRTHMGMFAFACEKCGLLFESKNTLQCHIQKHHKRQSKCYWCSKSKMEFSEWKDYEIHLKSHDFEHHMFTRHHSEPQLE